MSKIPLTNEQLMEAAPSIFTEAPIDTASSQYHFLQTSTILDTFRQAGYFPIMAGEAKARDTSNQPYVRHIIQFRSLQNILRPDSKEEFADIVISNSANLRSSLTLDLSYFRIACSNLLIVSSEQFMFHRIIHKGMQTFKIERAIEEIVAYMPKVEKQIAELKSIQLTPVEAKSLASAAIDIRLDTSKHSMNPEDLLKINREADEAPTAWNYYNRIQEGIINGTIKAKNLLTNKSYTTKPIKAFSENIRINKELHTTFMNLVALKKSYEPLVLAA